MKPKQTHDYLEINFLFLFFQEVINTAIKVTRRTNNINGNRGGIWKPIQNKNKHITTAINISKNSFIPNGLPNSPFILTHDFLNELLGYFSYLKRAEPISNEAKDIASIIQVTPNPLSTIVFKSVAGSPKKTTKLKKKPIISTIIAPIIIIIFPFSISNTSYYEIVFQLLNSWEVICN